ncbi:MAG: hypothetical protein R3C24_18260 [Cyanobacteriota/Melainabacteria group bacterium]
MCRRAWAVDLDFGEIAQGARMVTLAETAAQHSQQSAIVDVDQKPREEGDGDLGSAEAGQPRRRSCGAWRRWWWWTSSWAPVDQKHMPDRAVVQVDHQVFAALARESSARGTAESTASTKSSRARVPLRTWRDSCGLDQRQSRELRDSRDDREKPG